MERYLRDCKISCQPLSFLFPNTVLVYCHGMRHGPSEVVDCYNPARVNIAPIGPRAWAGFRWLVEMPPVIDHFIPLFELVLYDTMSLDAVALTLH